MTEYAMDPFEVLGLDAEAGDEEVRSAWIEAVRRHPPDRDPEGFRRAREAYDLLVDERTRITIRLFGRPDVETLRDLARKLDEPPAFVGPAPWRAALREAVG